MPSEFHPSLSGAASPIRLRDYAHGETRRKLAAGQILFREEDRARKIFEVVSGVLMLTRVMESGRRQVIAFGYPGDIVGFTDNGRYRTDCEVVAAAEVIVHRADAVESGTDNPELHRRLVKAALREIASMQDHFLMLGRKSASEKTASFLAVLMDRVGAPEGGHTAIKLPMSRSDIADFLGLTTETVCRTFSQFRADGVIALNGAQTVVVRRPDRLLELAERD